MFYICMPKTFAKFSCLIILYSFLTACTPVQSTPPSDMTEVLNEAVDAAWTEVVLTQSALPTATPTFEYPTPSPFPTQPP